jgi:hypothetical protein
MSVSARTPPVAIDPIFHDTIKAIALTSVNQEHTTAVELRHEAVRTEPIIERQLTEEAKAAEAAVLGSTIEKAPIVEVWEGGLCEGRRVQVSFGTGYREGNRQEWNSGILEQNISDSLHLWDIKFDTGINQTIALTKETQGREWQLQELREEEQDEDEDEEAESTAGGGNQLKLRAREVCPSILVYIKYTSLTIGPTRVAGTACCSTGWPQN